MNYLDIGVLDEDGTEKPLREDVLTVAREVKG